MEVLAYKCRHINSCLGLQFKVSQWSARKRFDLRRNIKRRSVRTRSSCISMEVTELDQLIEEISEKEMAAKK